MLLTPTIQEYSAAGFVLVPIPKGSKGPEGASAKGWNKRENCVVPDDWTGNIGLAHAYSRTCAVDIDDLEAATRWLDARGVSLGALLDEPEAVRVSSGRPNRAKLIYRLPDGWPPLVSKKIIEDKANIIDFRCASSTGTTVQDVLPPSIHPETGKPYEWQYADDMIGDWRALPVLPKPLHAIWQGLIEVEPKSSEFENSERVGLDELRELLKDHDPGCDRDAWVKILAIIHYETQGSAEGLALANEWSKGSDKYKGPKDVLTRWRSFHLDRAAPATAASLRADTPPASPDDFDVIEDAPTEAKKLSRFRVVPAQEFAVGRPLNWIIKGVLPKAEVIVIYGESGSGKTFMVLDMVASIATGRQWRDLKTEAGKVVYICAEGVGGFRQRLKAYSHQFAVPLEGLPGVIPDAPNFLEGKDPLEIAKQIKIAGGASVVVIDTLSAVASGGNENAGEDMGAVLGHCKGIHRATGAVVILIHHSGKDASKGARGWSGLRAAADAELEVIRQGDYRKLTITKQKDGNDSAEYGFKLTPVTIGIDEDDVEITSCVVEHTEVVQAPAAGRKLGAVETKIMTALVDLTPGAGDPVWVEKIVEKVAPQLTNDPGMRDQRKGRVRKALENLSRLEIINVLDGMVSHAT